MTAWTQRDEDRLIVLLERGYSYGTIARQLKRTRTAVIVRAKRHNMRLLTIGGVVSAREAAAVLGLGRQNGRTVCGWIARGWLRARNGSDTDRPLWRIQDDDLMAFLENSDYWMAWQPARLPDSALREWATEIRDGGPDWITVGEAARRVFIGVATMNGWIHRHGLAARRYGNWYVDARELDSFVVQRQRDEAAARERAARERRVQRKAAGQ